MPKKTIFRCRRPSLAKRCFSSPIIEHAIRDISSRIRDEELAWLFSNCFPNTLDTTIDYSVRRFRRPDTFVITGDIDAMWLRDSTNQVWPYLSFARKEPALRQMLEGVIRRQTRCVLLDPYANAFYKNGNERSKWKTDRTEMRDGVHERKYELDSLCSVLRLACGYYAQTGDISPFDSLWFRAVEIIIETITIQQSGIGESHYKDYTFARSGDNPADTIPFGTGHPALRCGLSKSHFRPSDDGSHLPFPIAANAMAVVSLRELGLLLRHLKSKKALVLRCEKLANEIASAIAQFGVVSHPDLGRVYAYEVDGFGSHYLMDDANVPSLLSLPYLGFIKAKDPTYRRTRKLILSQKNPYFFKGRVGEGVGGPHVGQGYIWPMGLIMRAMTSSSSAEVSAVLSALKHSHANTGFMHESFWKDDENKYTRHWFAWANTLFGELILRLDKKYPWCLAKPIK